MSNRSAAIFHFKSASAFGFQGSMHSLFQDPSCKNNTWYGLLIRSRQTGNLCGPYGVCTGCASAVQSCGWSLFVHHAPAGPEDQARTLSEFSSNRIGLRAQYTGLNNDTNSV